MSAPIFEPLIEPKTLTIPKSNTVPSIDDNKLEIIGGKTEKC